MDTARLLQRQLRVAHSFAGTDEERRQVEWWEAKVAELREEQPSAEPAQMELQAQATGTDGPR